MHVQSRARVENAERERIRLARIRLFKEERRERFLSPERIATRELQALLDELQTGAGAPFSRWH